MSWILDLFKRKPGGTVVGNAIRAVTHDLTSGVLGNGAMMLDDDSSGKPDKPYKPGIINFFMSLFD